MTHTAPLLTPAEASARIKAQGITLSHWAREHGFGRQTVYDILIGRNKGNFGEGFAVAVALGIKPAPTTSTQQQVA